MQQCWAWDVVTLAQPYNGSWEGKLVCGGTGTTDKRQKIKNKNFFLTELFYLHNLLQ